MPLPLLIPVVLAGAAALTVDSVVRTTREQKQLDTSGLSPVSSSSSVLLTGGSSPPAAAPAARGKASEPAPAVGLSPTATTAAGIAAAVLVGALVFRAMRGVL